MSAITILANYKGENAGDYTTEQYKGYTFINTAGHGYLALGSDDNGYSDGLAIACLSNYSYILDTLVFLEEDCDAPEFLRTGITNFVG
jgi:hypothetical protein